MTAAVFLAVLFAAALHATWNALLKHGTDKYLGMTAVVAGHLPFAIPVAAYVPVPAPESWPYIVSGIGLHVGYQLFLLWAYRAGDLTQVYPIARGTGPLIVAAFSIIVLGVSFDRMEIAGIATIGLGLMSLSLVRQQGGERNGRAALLAFMTGCFIAGYTINDGLGARAAGTAVGFYAWEAIGNGVLFTIAMAIYRPGILRDMLTLTTGRRAFIIGGGSSYVAYTIVTWAFTQAPIALVAALRETSIVFALFIGAVFLRERFDAGKAISTFLTLAGAIAIRLAR